MISVVCCYNDKRIYNEMLLESLEKQTCDYELITVDNQNADYSSIAEAFNSVSTNIKGDVVLFCHQDICFQNSDTLEKIEKNIKENPDSIVGLCGITKKKEVYSNLKYKKTNEYITKKRVEKLMEVESLDECFFGMKKELIDELGWFDEKTCDGWHLYAAELCIRAKRKNKRILVSPEECFHREEPSKGVRIDKPFLKIFKQIRKKNKDLKEIYSVSLVASAKNPNFTFTMLKLKMKYRLNKHNEDYCWREQ